MPLHLGDDVTVTCFLFERTQSGLDPRGSFRTEIHFELTGKDHEPVAGMASFSSLGDDHASPVYLGFRLGEEPTRFGVARERQVESMSKDGKSLPISSIAYSVRAYYDQVTGRLPTSKYQKTHIVNESASYRFRLRDGVWTMLPAQSDEVGRNA